MITSVQSPLYLRGKTQLFQLSMTTAAAETSPINDSSLPGGVYALWSTEDCHFRINTAASGDAVTVNNGLPLPAGVIYEVVLQLGDVVNAKTDSAASGVLHCMNLNSIG